MTRCAIVTASDSGIGKATAVALARDGFDVGITWHDDEAGALGTADQHQLAELSGRLAHADQELAGVRALLASLRAQALA